MFARHVSRTYVHKISAPPEKVFPMLCPVCEKEYVPGWDATIIHSDSGLAEKGCVFQTPNENSLPATWIITQHDETAGKIQFAIVTPDSHASTLDVSLEPNGKNNSALTFTYTHVALTDRGQEFVKTFTAELFRTKMATFETALNNQLRA